MSDLPPLAPQTERILAAAERGILPSFHETAREDLALVTPDLDTEPADLSSIDPDPASMLRLKATGAPREVERPDAVEDQIKLITPQFFLRDTHRTERYADAEWLEWQSRTYDDRAWLRTAGGMPPAAPRAPDLASRVLATEVAERAAVVVETRWHEHFGRPDPGEPLDA